MDEVEYKLRNYFYVGNYEACIQMNNIIKNIKNEETFNACQFYIFRSFIRIDRVAKAIELIKDMDYESLCPLMRAIYLTVRYYNAIKEEKENIKNDLNGLCIQYPHLDEVKILLADIMMDEKSYSNAYTTLKDSLNIECCYIRLTLLLSINRSDLAIKELDSMRRLNDYSPLTLLAKCYYFLSTNKQLQDVIHFCEELLSKYTPTATIFNLKACAYIHLNQLDQAEIFLKKALEIEPTNELIAKNWYVVCLKLKKPQNIIENALEKCPSIQEQINLLSTSFHSSIP